MPSMQWGFFPHLELIKAWASTMTCYLEMHGLAQQWLYDTGTAQHLRGAPDLLKI